MTQHAGSEKGNPSAPQHQQEQQKQQKPAQPHDGRSGEGSSSALDRMRQQEKARATGSRDKSGD